MDSSTPIMVNSNNNIPSPKSSPLLPSIETKQQNSQLQQTNPLSNINLRELRLKNKQTEQAIKSIQTKIIYMRNKEQKTVKKVLNIKRKLTSLENVRSKTNEVKIKYKQEKQKQQQEILKKTEFNKLIKDHLKYNKKIVNTLMNHKVNEEIKQFKTKNNKLELLTQVQRENLRQENVQKANKVRMDHIDAHERRKLYFLEKLHQFKQIKEDKLKEEIRQRQRQQQMIYELEQKQKMLLEKLSASERFRIKCQAEYQEARKKYKSFYELSRGLARGHRSCEQSRISQNNEGKADIFIS